MAVGPYALCTLAQVKTFLNITSSNHDTFLENLIDRVTALIEAHTGVHFAQRTLTEYQDGDGHSTFFYTRQFPIISITSLHDDSDREYGDDDLVDATDYVFYEDSGKIQLDSVGSPGVSPTVFAKGFKNIKIVYVAGYATIPEDVQEGAIELTAWIYKRSFKDAGMMLERIESAFPISTNEWPSHVLFLLDKYTRFYPL